LGDRFDVKELEKGFLELNTSNFHQVAHHRITSLLRSNALWHAFQMAFAYATTANAQIVNEMTEAIRTRYTTDLISLDYEAMANRMMEELLRIQMDGLKYAEVLRELDSLGQMLEAEKLSLRKIAGFHKRAAVTALIERLRASFPDESESDAHANATTSCRSNTAWG
jgi:hypothetical protein